MVNVNVFHHLRGSSKTNNKHINLYLSDNQMQLQTPNYFHLLNILYTIYSKTTIINNTFENLGSSCFVNLYVTYYKHNVYSITRFEFHLK